MQILISVNGVTVVAFVSTTDLNPYAIQPALYKYVSIIFNESVGW